MAISRSFLVLLDHGYDGTFRWSPKSSKVCNNKVVEHKMYMKMVRVNVTNRVSQRS